MFMIMSFLCLFLLLDHLYWQVLSLSMVLCLYLLERKFQAQRSYDLTVMSHAVHVFSVVE